MRTAIAIITCSVVLGVLPASAQRIITLDESRALALQNNVRILNSALEVEAARHVKHAAVTHYFPSVNAAGTAFRAGKDLVEISTQGGNLPVYDGDPAHLMSATQFAYMPSSTMGMFRTGTFGILTAVQPVFAGGRIWNGNRLASLGVNASEEKVRIARNDVDLLTEQYYWTVVSLAEKRKTITRYEALLDRFQRRVQDAHASGLVTMNDVLKVRLKRQEVLLNKAKLEHGSRLASIVFCQHIGLPYDSTLVLSDSLPASGSPAALYCDKDEALQRRAEYRLLDLGVRVEELQSQMKLGEYLPQVGVGATGVYMKIDKGKDRTVGMVFATVSIPISGWWGGAHELQERNVKEQMAVNTRNENAELLLLQIEKTWQDLTDAFSEYQLTLESVEQSEENLRLNEDSYGHGVTGITDLLEAQAMVQQTQDRLVDAKAEYARKRTTYLQVTGR